LPISLNL